ncbi:MAG TPA: hypothetical protein VMF06_24545 [Candidatus Limnocylindria bacterium]|nr:hypothetical protein [Candidatus Limnocylindria bacterium]
MSVRHLLNLVCLVLGLALLAGYGTSKGLAASDTEGVWAFQVLHDSTLVDDCPICGRPTILQPLRGRFEMRQVAEDPLFARFEISHVDFTAGSPGGTQYIITGQGTYRVGGEVAVVQDIYLELTIDNGFEKKVCYFTNTTSTLERHWPILKIALGQTNGTLAHLYGIDLSAAPIRDLWFSTAAAFHPAKKIPGSAISAGDLISIDGHVVRRNNDLTGNLGIMPGVPDLGLDAFTVRPGGELAFSIEQNVFSERIGDLHAGDMLSDRGSVIKSYADLLNPFGVQPPVPDPGLDALYLGETDEVFFSISQDLFSEHLGKSIRRGDLLSSQGSVIKTHEQLLAQFNPANPKLDPGLDGVWIWPSGEVWFSVETSFSGTDFQTYAPGDILSDQGYIAFRNVELLAAFGPVEDLGDFGLDSLYIVSDATPVLPAPQFTGVHPSIATGSVDLDWKGTGHVFQLLRATEISGPYEPISPIIPDTHFTDSGGIAGSVFYRLLQW